MKDSGEWEFAGQVTKSQARQIRRRWRKECEGWTAAVGPDGTPVLVVDARRSPTVVELMQALQANGGHGKFTVNWHYLTAPGSGAGAARLDIHYVEPIDRRVSFLFDLHFDHNLLTGAVSYDTFGLAASALGRPEFFHGGVMLLEGVGSPDLGAMLALADLAA